VEENPRHQTYCQIGDGGLEMQKTGKYELQLVSRTVKSNVSGFVLNNIDIRKIDL